MNDQQHLRNRLQYRTLWTSVLVVDGMRRARARHRKLVDDERGVVSIEYVLIAAAAAAIAILLGGMIWNAVNDAAGNIKTEIDPNIAG